MTDRTDTTADLPALPATPPSRYRHYKGGEYEVIGVARHSETLEPLVVYRPLYNDTGLWVRPHAMFFGEVEVDGVRMRRFASMPAGNAAPLHIGIVGCSAEGAALCYRTICAEAQALLGPHAHPQVSMHTPSLAEYVARLEAGDLEGVAALMLDSAARLARAGANVLVCPDNTIHQAMPLVLPRSPLPWLHIADVVVSAAAAQGHKCLGIMGTRWLISSDVYPDACRAAGLECVRPEPWQRDKMSQLIMDELVQGKTEAATVAYFQEVIGDFKAAGCDAVVLGCTEIPLIISDANSVLPTLDSTRLLARAAIARAFGTAAPS